jgi:hypothetical protein
VEYWRNALTNSRCGDGLVAEALNCGYRKEGEGKGVKGLARDGTRWPSGARSLPSQTNRPSCMGRNIAIVRSLSVSRQFTAYRCPTAPEVRTVWLWLCGPGTGGRRSPLRPQSFHFLYPFLPVPRPLTNQTFTASAIRRRVAPMSRQRRHGFIFESKSSSRIPGTVSKILR